MTKQKQTKKSVQAVLAGRLNKKLPEDLAGSLTSFGRPSWDELTQQGQDIQKQSFTLDLKC